MQNESSDPAEAVPATHSDTTKESKMPDEIEASCLSEQPTETAAAQVTPLKDSDSMDSAHARASVSSMPSTSMGTASATKRVRQPLGSSKLTSCDKESSLSTKSDGHSVIVCDRSASRDSIVEDPRSSFVDSISAASGRPTWGTNDDEPSISSIKGDSVSATIADYNRKHLAGRHRRAASSDNQSRVSSRLGESQALSTGTNTNANIINNTSSTHNKNDDSSVNLNYYAASCSSAAGTSQQQQAPRGGPCSSTGRSRNQQHNIQQQQQQQHQNQRSRKHSRQKRGSGHSARVHQRNSSGTSGHSSSLLEQALDFYDLPQGTIYQIEPIVIRGNGNMTLFGLSNSFSSEFPPSLLGRVSREEFTRTMSHINSVLRSQQSLSAKLLLFGGLFCCCSLGLSLVWPSIVLKRRSKANLEKFLANENQRLYSKLGLNWRLGQRCFNRFVEHVIIIEFNPKIDPYVPD